MATYSEARRVALDLPATTRACAQAARGLGPEVTIEVEDTTFGLVVASRSVAGAAPERYRWELWPVKPALTEAKLQIETEGVGFFARGRLKETAERLFEQLQAGAGGAARGG